MGRDLEAKLARHSSLDPAVQEFMNVVNFYGHQVEMDNQGRILLPQFLRDKAKLTAEVKVMGQNDHLAIHNLAELAKVVPIDGMADDKQSRISGYLTEAKV
jgi:MraZ protein